MKVLMTTPDPQDPGGVAFFCNSLRKPLGPGVDYFTIGTRVGVRRTPVGTVHRVYRDAQAFRRQLETRAYSLVHLNPSLLPKATLRDGHLVRITAAADVRVLAFFHGWNPRVKRILQRFGRILLNATFYRADAIAVVASDYQRQFEAMGCPVPVHVMTSVVPDDVVARARTAPDLRAQRRKPDVCRLLFLSRIEKEKGIFETLDAFSLLKRKHPGLELVVAGSGSALTAAQSRAQALGLQDVTFTGYLRGDAKHDAFQAADIYVLPTAHGEGMPHSLLEAMAYGMPFLTCPVGGIRDFMQNETMGYAIQDRRPHVIASTLDPWIDDVTGRETIGRFNQAYCAEHFAASSVARRLWQLYRQVTDEAEIT